VELLEQGLAGSTDERSLAELEGELARSQGALGLLTGLALASAGEEAG